MIRLGLVFIIGVFLGWGVSTLTNKGAASSGLSPVERAWTDYVQTERLILLRGPSGAGEKLAEENKSAYQALVSNGELVRIEYNPTDHALDLRLHQELSRLGCKDYRCGFSVDGGQWPAGLLTVEKTFADSFRKILSEQTRAAATP